ncbi:MAG TPA: TetR family transcriptional regulator C-terminal domain-containing protein, partial [Novosphingobium sp.]|nr:TetR family transcriptional regulator C-terminal domain-containing protein [Novosphingobium sp.]
RIGIEELTFKQVAAATGYSTAIVSHYFQNKNELLFKVYELANGRARARLMAAFEADLPLIDCFEQILPIGEDSQKNWRVWLAFWGRVHLDPAYAEQRRLASVDSLALYRAMLAERAPALHGAALDEAAERLLVAVAGTALEACFNPAHWSARRQRAIIAAELARLPT